MIKYIATAICCFLFVTPAFASNPVPTVVGPPIPQAVVPGSGEFTLRVYGANFVPGAVVNWNRSPRSTTFISARELKTQILASDVSKPTAGYITVTNPLPGGGVSSSSYGLVEVHTPTKTIVVDQPGVYLVEGDPSYVVTADFTGDGVLDLVIGVSDSLGQVMLNTGNGDGTFQQAISIGSHFLDSANSISFGDFDGDGTLDVVYGWQNSKSGLCAFQQDPPCYLKVLLGNGQGRFRGLHPFGRYGNQNAVGIVAGDFNNDGILDLAVLMNFNVGEVFLGNGDGTFKHHQTIQFGAIGGGDAVTADFNGDGKLDLVVEYGKSLYLLLGNGDGTFKKARRIATDKYNIGCGFGPWLLLNDFDGDGNPDLAFCDLTSSGFGRIGVLLGNGDGTFQKPVYYPTGFGPQGGLTFAAGDFNSDSKTDLIAATPGQNDERFEVFSGNGDGTFQKAKRISLPDNGGGEVGLVPGDFNSDGLLDFVMVDASGLEVYIQK
jgi:hypothetical protein